MVVAGWIPQVNSPAAESNKMTAKGILICRDNSHPFQERTLSLENPVKIGRSVARARATPANAIFDCKVLSRNHAVLWYSSGKFYLQDTKSSNGTFINNQRLSSSGIESEPREVCSGDIVQFGVDVVESTKKLTHGCIIATLKLYLPDGKEAKASPSTSVLCPPGNVSLEDLYKLYQFVQEAGRREKALQSKLTYMEQLVETAKKAAGQSWKALIDEDRLLSWIETVESQLAVYSKNFAEDKIRNEMVSLLQEKAQYQNAAKEALQKVLQEKLEVSEKLVQLESRLNETEEECQSLHDVAKHAQTEIQELAGKYSEAQRKLQETTSKLTACEEKLKSMQQGEQERQQLSKRIGAQLQCEKNLRDTIRELRLLRANTHKQINLLKNYMLSLHETTDSGGGGGGGGGKAITDVNSETKNEREANLSMMHGIINQILSWYGDDYFENDSESNVYSDEGDNQTNSDGTDSKSELQSRKSNCLFSKDDANELSNDADNITEYILPPASRKTLINGNVDNSEANEEADTNSETTDETYSITSDDISEKSVIELKKDEERREEEEDESSFVKEEAPIKHEVRFACGENGEQLEIHYEPIEDSGTVTVVSGEEESQEKGEDFSTDSKGKAKLSEAVLPVKKKDDVSEKSKGGRGETVEDSNSSNSSSSSSNNSNEHLEGDYAKTLKPLTKSESMQQNLHSKDFVLQTFIGSLESLLSEDCVESQQAVNKELEELKHWLIRESNDTVVNKLKDVYYRSKNECQRIQEVNEELVILKEKYNAFVDEKAEIIKKYTALKAQCGDLLNATYAVPIHYVAPIVIALIWMLLEKIF